MTIADKKAAKKVAQESDEWEEKVYYVNSRTGERTTKIPKGATVVRTEKRKILTKVVMKDGVMQGVRTEETWLGGMAGFQKIMTWDRKCSPRPQMRGGPPPLPRMAGFQKIMTWDRKCSPRPQMRGGPPPLPRMAGFQKIMTWDRKCSPRPQMRGGPPPPPPLPPTQVRPSAPPPPPPRATTFECRTYYSSTSGKPVKVPQDKALLSLIRGEITEKPPKPQKQQTYYTPAGKPIRMNQDKALFALIRGEITEKHPSSKMGPPQVSLEGQHAVLLALIRGDWKEVVSYSPVRRCSVVSYIHSKTGRTVSDLAAELKSSGEDSKTTCSKLCTDSSDYDSSDSDWDYC
eukprot:TRINITY_DN192_c0_g2_i1.p1 TRINITY_DN192_c0_g2~~TRINITY_DN192_c0_g2_i1.p1  ORF type:complete len:345 (+),score=39.34 TRINITY_DN192_c0_g2_i1:70-1104(+)